MEKIKGYGKDIIVKFKSEIQNLLLFQKNKPNLPNLG